MAARDRSGRTALHYCCAGGGDPRPAHAADLLTMAAPDLVDRRDDDGLTPLHLAAIAGDTRMVGFLLANGADVRAVDNEGHTVVHWATGRWRRLRRAPGYESRFVVVCAEDRCYQARFCSFSGAVDE